jgi:hypothetical protein
MRIDLHGSALGLAPWIRNRAETPMRIPNTEKKPTVCIDIDPGPRGDEKLHDLEAAGLRTVVQRRVPLHRLPEHTHSVLSSGQFHINPFLPITLEHLS